MNIVLVTNIPAPYRERIHELVSLHFKNQYTVIYCAEAEPNRKWKFKYGNYKKIFLSKRSKGYAHNNLKIWFHLGRIKPDVIITTGYYPTMIYSLLWTIVNRKKHIPFTDGTVFSESLLSKIHFLTRKVFFRFSQAFIGASTGSSLLFKKHGIADGKIYRSCLCVDNSAFYCRDILEREYDLMFSGQFVDGKLPLFFASVARKVKEKMGSCKVLMLGSGVKEPEVIAALNKNKIDFSFPGFVQQKNLPEYYAKSKIFLFPTINDTWGIVANEAMASGVPVITCKNAGVSEDLVIHGENGFILPLDDEVWSDHVVKLLRDQFLLEKFSEKALLKVKAFNFESASLGIIEAVESVIKAKAEEIL